MEGNSGGMPGRNRILSSGTVFLSNEGTPGKARFSLFPGVNLKDPGGTKDKDEEHEIQGKTLQPEVPNQENVERLSFDPEKTTSHSGLTVVMLAPLLALASSTDMLPFPYEESKAAEKVLREYWDPSDGKGEILDETCNLEKDIFMNDIEYIYSDADGKHSNLIKKKLSFQLEDLFQRIIQADGNQKNLIEKFHTEFSFEDMVYVSWSAGHSLLQSNDSLKNENLLWNSMDVFLKSERKEEKKGIGKNASYSCDDSVCSSVKSSDLLGEKDVQWNAYETQPGLFKRENKEENAGMENMILIDDDYEIAILL